jgi:pimeloyl-ACP methyl ester carboxylesterase
VYGRSASLTATVRRGGSIRRLLARVLLAALALVVLLNWTYGRLPATPAPSGRFLEAAGVRIRYLEAPGAGPAVLLLHGLPGTAEDFNLVTRRLAGRRTVAIDRPGYGFSSGGYFPFARQLQVIEAVIRKLSLGRVILVGHSYGGGIALGFAERHPQALSGLVLVDAAATCAHNSFAQRAQARLAQALTLPVIRQIANATFSQLVLTLSVKQGDREAFDPDRVDRAHEERLLAINMKRGNLEALAGETLAANGVISSINRGLGRIRTPAIVIQGDRDRLVEPECGRRLAARLPDAKLVMVSGGHMVPYTHPGVVAAAVREV